MYHHPLETIQKLTHSEPEAAAVEARFEGSFLHGDGAPYSALLEVKLY
jgi:hypothetical protein